MHYGVVNQCNFSVTYIFLYLLHPLELQYLQKYFQTKQYISAHYKEFFKLGKTISKYNKSQLK